MARAQATDFFHNFKFHCKITTKGVAGAEKIGASGGFMSVVMPEVNVEQVEYKEGTMLYRRKFPGDVTFSDITLTRGVAKADTNFYDWIRSAYLGLSYRVDLVILHFHRDELSSVEDYSSATAKRQIQIFEAIPTRVKLGSDLDSMASDISVQEIDIAYESFKLVDKHTSA